MKTIHIKVSFARWRFNWTRPRRANSPRPSWPSSFLCRAVTRCQRLPCLALPPPRLLLTFSLSSRESTPLSLPLSLLFFLPPPCAKLWPTFIKNFLLVEPRWSRFLCSVSIDIEPTIQSGTKRSESATWRERRRRRRILHRRNRFFFFLRGKPGLLKDFASRIGGVNAGLMGNFWWPGNDNGNVGAWLVGIEDGRINRVDGRWWFLLDQCLDQSSFIRETLFFSRFSRYLSLRLGMYITGIQIFCVYLFIYVIAFV